MPSKKHKSSHSADRSDSRSAKVAQTLNNPSSPLKNPNPNLNPSPPKSSKKKPNLSTDSMEKQSNPSSQGKLKAQDSHNEDDTLTILNGVINFRMKNGANPTPSSIKRFHDDIRGSLHSEVTEDKLYNKLRHLRHKFRKIANSGAGPSGDDRAFYDLSLKAWETAEETQKKKKKKTEAKGERFEEDGEEEDQEMEISEGEDADDSLKYFTQEMREYWKTMGLPESELDLGLKTVDRAKAKALEKKLRNCLEVDMKLRVKRHDLKREICAALVAAHKGL